MAYVPVPKDLTKIKTKVALNLTKRQIICFGAAAIVGVPLFFCAKRQHTPKRSYFHHGTCHASVFHVRHV